MLYAALGCIFIYSGFNLSPRSLTPDHIRYKAWYFLALTIGTFMMAIGIAVRVAFYYNLHWRGGYIFQQMFIILSVGAGCHLFCSRLAMPAHRGQLRPLGQDSQPHRRTEPHVHPARARRSRVYHLGRWVSWLCRTLLTAVITFVIQGGGGGLAAGGGNIANIGVKLLLAGLVAQLVSFGLFSIMWCLFTYRV